jgi:hypothetical protein
MSIRNNLSKIVLTGILTGSVIMYTGCSKRIDSMREKDLSEVKLTIVSDKDQIEKNRQNLEKDKKFLTDYLGYTADDDKTKEEMSKCTDRIIDALAKTDAPIDVAVKTLYILDDKYDDSDIYVFTKRTVDFLNYVAKYDRNIDKELDKITIMDIKDDKKDIIQVLINEEKERRSRFGLTVDTYPMTGRIEDVQIALITYKDSDGKAITYQFENVLINVGGQKKDLIFPDIRLLRRGEPVKLSYHEMIPNCVKMDDFVKGFIDAEGEAAKDRKICADGIIRDLGYISELIGETK